MHRFHNIDPLPDRRVCLHFVFDNLPTARQNYWLLADPQSGGEACYADPGYDTDLYSVCSLRTMAATWKGLDTVKKSGDRRRFELTGAREIAARSRSGWASAPLCMTNG